MPASFHHEKLEVYQTARKLNRQLHSLFSELPRGHGESVDNLKRAAKSITRNLAEGSGKWRVRHKIHFYQIAHGSATECAASLDELVDFGAVNPEQVREPKEILARVVAMLIGMIRSLENRNSETMAK